MKANDLARMVVTFDVAVARTARGWDAPETRVTEPGENQVGTKLALSAHQVQVLEMAGVPQALPALMAPSGRTDRTKFRNQVLRPLLDADLLAMTIPDKPRSSKQKYITTPAGAQAIRKEPH